MSFAICTTPTVLRDVPPPFWQLLGPNTLHEAWFTELLRIQVVTPSTNHLHKLWHLFHVQPSILQFFIHKQRREVFQLNSILFI